MVHVMLDGQKAEHTCCYCKEHREGEDLYRYGSGHVSFQSFNLCERKIYAWIGKRVVYLYHYQ